MNSWLKYIVVITAFTVLLSMVKWQHQQLQLNIEVLQKCSEKLK